MVVPVFLAFGALKPCSAKFPSKTAFLTKKLVGNSLNHRIQFTRRKYLTFLKNMIQMRSSLTDVYSQRKIHDLVVYKAALC